MKKRSIIHDLLFYGIIIALIVVVLSTMFTDSGKQEPLTYDQVNRYITEGQVTEVYISNQDILTLKLVDGNQVSYELADVNWFRDTFDQKILDSGIKYEIQPITTYPWWVS